MLLWPITGSGYLLARDMVFTPHQPLDLSAIGASSAAPRAVPVDALVALAEHVLDGAVVGRLAVLVPVLLAGLGAARMLGSHSLPARLATCGFAMWNPYVIERLRVHAAEQQSSASRRSSLLWRWPTRLPASPGS